MIEPTEEKLTRPSGGWPVSMARFELPEGLTLEAAALELAGVSRRMRSGVSAQFRKVAMIAFPDQTTTAIAAAWQRLNFAEQDAGKAGRLPDPGVTRWTPDHKLAVLVAIGAGKLSAEDAACFWNIEADELAEWGMRYERFGRDGLSVERLQELGR